MTQPSSGTPDRETGVDRFEQEIEDLEQSFWRENRGRFLVFIGVALGAAAIIVGAFLVVGRSQTPADPSKTTIMSIELTEPRPGSVAQRPTRFRWESIANTAMYVFRIRESGGERDLVERSSRTNSIDLTQEEAARIIRGGRYSWVVEARSAEGWMIGQGEQGFTF